MGIIIPTRKYLTYEELRERWQCSDNDLRYSIVAGELKPSIKAFEALSIPSWEFDSFSGEICPDGPIEDGQEGYALKVKPKDWLFLQEPKQTGPLACKFFLATQERNPDKPKDSWDIPFASWFWLPYPMTLDVLINEAVFLMAEVHRYELKYEKDAAPVELVKPLITSERNTLLTIIAALAKQAKIDINEAGKSAQYISGLTDELGANVSKRAIEDHLKKIPGALEVRMK